MFGHTRLRRASQALLILLLLALASACASAPAAPATSTAGSGVTPGVATPSPAGATPGGATPTSPSAAVLATMDNLIPRPLSATPDGGSFSLAPGAGISIEPDLPELRAIGQYLADKLNPATGYGITVGATAGAPGPGKIYLTTAGADPALGEEGYLLTIKPDGVTLQAPQPAGLFRGIQTIRQLLPPAIESAKNEPGPWPMATGVIKDMPRFSWRGAMLDVARHFFSVDEVKRYIDQIAAYKLNRFHLHLSDDQGWRIEIKSWPNLTAHGGSTAVDGDPGGFFTQAQYAEIVAYAQARYITVIPEIDMPGHTNAALASYPELNCDGVAPELYTDIQVGFSALCLEKEITYTFIDDVVRELAAITPGEYFHIGGDEANTIDGSDYVAFITRAGQIVEKHGKRMIGWEEIADADIPAGSIAQYWASPDEALLAAEKQIPLIMSPSDRVYLDMQYDSSTTLGQNWAGYTEVDDSYSWDPGRIIPGIPQELILGLEAPLWTEKVRTMDDIEYMAFPRIAGVGELGWSPVDGRGWPEYKDRLATHGPRWDLQGISFYRSPKVSW